MGVECKLSLQLSRKMRTSLGIKSFECMVSCKKYFKSNLFVRADASARIGRIRSTRDFASRHRCGYRARRTLVFERNVIYSKGRSGFQVTAIGVLFCWVVHEHTTER